MLGSIAGDIIGSRFEFHNLKSKDFRLFERHCHFTDDTVMTIAVARTLASFKDGINDDNEFKQKLILDMHIVGKKYPRCGYGGNFYDWIMNDYYRPYNSWGNGSAMRVSAIALYAKSLEECEHIAKLSAEVSHNHPEGIKGAIVTAGVTYLARTHKSKDEIKTYILNYYKLDKSVDEIRKDYEFDVSCQGSVPQAMTCFLESDSFEDCMRNAISIGGDSDTIAAIVGSVAEYYYGAPAYLEVVVKSYLDDYLNTELDNALEVLKNR